MVNNDYENDILLDSDVSLFDSEPLEDTSQQPDQKILKVNEFERDINSYSSKVSKYTEESRYVRDILNNPLAKFDFTASSVQEILDNPKLLTDYIKLHNKTVNNRHKVLEAYYEGKNVSILYFKNRRKQRNKSDVRVVSPFASVIVDTQLSYSFSNNIKIEDKNKVNIDFINELFNSNTLNVHNKNLALDCLIFGHAFEINFVNKKGINKLKKLSVYNTFIIYSDDLENEPLCAVYYTIKNGKVNITLYFDEIILTYDNVDLEELEKLEELPLSEEFIQLNAFNKVQVIEYLNNDNKMSAFESVISLIDAHDAIMSDIINVSNDTPDSLLKIKGVLSKESLEALNTSLMSEANALYLEGATSPDNSRYTETDAEYMKNNYDVTANKVIIDTLENLIFSLSKTPNFSDSSFGTLTSGVAMQYRLYTTETAADKIQNKFKEGLAERFNMWAFLFNVLKNPKYSNLNLNTLNFKFVENVPVNVFERIEFLQKAGAKFSNETLLSYIPDLDVELEKTRLKNQ